MDECRKAFEEWAVSEGMSIKKGTKNYTHGVTHTAWKAWQARDASTEAKASGGVINPPSMKPSEPGYYLCHYKGWGWAETNFGYNKEWNKNHHTNAKMDGWMPLPEDSDYALQLPAPQSPVVPGVEELYALVRDEPWRDDDWQDQARQIAKAIHAHLLANARESREDRHREAVRLLKLCQYGNVSESDEAEIANFLATVGKDG